jgi:hypothetical protein
MESADKFRVCGACREELVMEGAAKEIVQSKDARSEPSLHFWEDDAGAPDTSTHDGQHGDAFLGSGAAKEDVDQFEPIPLEMAMERAGAWRNPQAALESPNHSEDHSEHSSISSTLFEEDYDDDEDHAMVAWASEFVHCPLCSLVTGRGDLKELPIHDIRAALIG